MRVYGKNPSHHRVKFYEFRGVKRTIAGWAQHYGLPYTCIQSRIKRGKALDAPKSRAGRPRF